MPDNKKENWIVWSDEGPKGYSICHHSGSLISNDHRCIGTIKSKEDAEFIIEAVRYMKENKKRGT